MNKKSLLVVAAGALMSLSALTSCGPSRADTQVDQLLPEDDPSSMVTIKFWHCLGSAKTNNLESIVSAFNNDPRYKGKYNVVLDDTAGGSYDELDTTIRTKMAAGEVPAMAIGYPDSFSVYMTKNIKRSNILRLDNFIKDAKFGFSQDEIDDFVEGYYKEGTGYQFEGTWSMPMYKSTEVMFYNASYLAGDNKANLTYFTREYGETEIFTEFMKKYNRVHGYTGLKPLFDDFSIYLNDLKEYTALYGGYCYDVPQTWEELMGYDDAAGSHVKGTAEKILEDYEREDFQKGQRFIPVGYDSDANMMISKMAMNDIPYTINFEKDEQETRNPVEHLQFVNDGAKKLLARLSDNINDGLLCTKYSLDSTGSTYTNELFCAQECVFSIGSTAGVSYQMPTDFCAKVAAVPHENGKKMYIQQGPSICFFDNLNPYIHKGAWLFYKFLSETTNNCLLATENDYEPVRISSYTDDVYIDHCALAGYGMNYDIPNLTPSLKEHYMTSAVFVGSSTARNEMGQLINYVIGNGDTPDQALSKAYGKCIQAV